MDIGLRKILNEEDFKQTLNALGFSSAEIEREFVSVTEDFSKLLVVRCLEKLNNEDSLALTSKTAGRPGSEVAGEVLQFLKSKDRSLFLKPVEDSQKEVFERYFAKLERRVIEDARS